MRLFILLSFNVFMLLEAYGYGITNESDRQALLEFKSQVSEVKILSSWNSSYPLCSWKGVTCGRKHKRVTGLDLGGFHLGGAISPSIGNLSFLIYLNLSDNYFGGNIPQEVGNLFRLKYLCMSYNFLKGGIPVSLSNCSRLLSLDLYLNHLGKGVPSELGSLSKLVSLDLGKNQLSGKLPASLGNLTSLEQVSFTNNRMEGEIPNDIIRWTRVVVLLLSSNKFSGVFPPSIYNLSSLKFLNIFGSGFSGSLRPDFGNLLPKLREVYMGRNYFTGKIPPTLANISNLQVLGMEFNRLIGSIPPSFGKVRNLQGLSFLGNSLGSRSIGDLEFLDALTNCTQLQKIDVGQNRLGGDLPTSVSNFSVSLVYLSLQHNFISGSIPPDIWNLKRLQVLWLAENLLTGSLPHSLGKMLELRAIDLSKNRMSGEIPSSIGNITQLVILLLSSNKFTGLVPPSLGNCSHLLELNVGYNKLYGTIPQEIMQIPSLVNVSMSNNFLTGSLPKDFGRLENVGILSVAHNKLSGRLPQALGKCLTLEQLYLQGNSFDGAIPDISGLVGLKKVDFSSNNLSGSIPGYLANLSKLEYLNLSFNNFEGKVPTGGKFQNATIVSVFGNKKLCGGIKELKLMPCFAQATSSLQKKHFSRLKKVVMGVTISIAILLMLIIALVSLCWLRKRKKNKQSQQTNNPTPMSHVFHEKISYRDLQNATDGFSPSNMVGYGSFGTVFKALFPVENKVVAVKVLNMERRGAMKSFMAECESLKDIRHRNLVKLLTACSSTDFQGNDFRALIYEFMPNGSLDMWLHPEEVEEICRPSRNLTFLERLNIAIDVASVLDYLHVQCHEPIAHCDIKPSNVLLDNDLIAHVSDFGLARLLLKFDKESFLNQLSSASVRGTIGYAAPEYGMGVEPSTHGDVYSFGILLLEMFTGKRPTNGLFGGNLTLHSYTKSALPDRVLDIADQSILHSGLRVGFPIVECLKLVFEVGLRCCEESPTNRLGMSEATKDLVSIKERFFKARRTTKS